jgi:hypothetical protein
MERGSPKMKCHARARQLEQQIKAAEKVAARLPELRRQLEQVSREQYLKKLKRTSLEPALTREDAATDDSDSDDEPAFVRKRKRPTVSVEEKTARTASRLRKLERADAVRARKADQKTKKAAEKKPEENDAVEVEVPLPKKKASKRPRMEEDMDNSDSPINGAGGTGAQADSEPGSSSEDWPSTEEDEPLTKPIEPVDGTAASSVVTAGPWGLGFLVGEFKEAADTNYLKATGISQRCGPKATMLVKAGGSKPLRKSSRFKGVVAAVELIITDTMAAAEEQGCSGAASTMLVIEAVEKILMGINETHSDCRRGCIDCAGTVSVTTIKMDRCQNTPLVDTAMPKALLRKLKPSRAEASQWFHVKEMPGRLTGDGDPIKEVITGKAQIHQGDTLFQLYFKQIIPRQEIMDERARCLGLYNDGFPFSRRINIPTEAELQYSFDFTGEDGRIYVSAQSTFSLQRPKHLLSHAWCSCLRY